MKCKFLSIIAFAATTTIAQNVNIPDDNFRALLLLDPSINTNIDTEISVAEAEAYTGELNETHFGVWGSEVNDITGLEAFINITSLDGVAYINDTLDLKPLTKLERVNLNFSNATNWKGIDITGLSNLTYLELNGKSTYPDHIYFEMGNNPALDTFDISNITVDTVDFRNATSLTFASGLWENGLEHILLNNTPSLEKLEFRGGSLSDIDLSESPSLKYLTVPSDGNLTSLDFSNNPKLVGFQAVFNPLTTVNFGSADSLEWIDVRYNELTEISLPNSLKLDRALINDNLLTSVDLKNSSNLRILTAYNNSGLDDICISDVDFANSNPLSVDSFEEGDFLWTDDFYIKDATAEWSNCISTNVKDIENTELAVFPNPASDVLSIKTTSLISSVKIYDNEGREVFSVNDNFQFIDIANLSKGIYFLKVNSVEGEIATEKIILK